MNDCAYSGFGVVQAGNDCIVQDEHALTNGLPWVVENGVEVGIVRKTKTGPALLSPINNKVRAVRKRLIVIRECRRGDQKTERTSL